MKVDKDSLDIILLKKERAFQLLNDLTSSITSWTEGQQPFRVSLVTKDRGSTYTLRLNLVEPIPLIWSIILAEAVYNLRSALDQCVYWLTVDNMGEALEQTSFPIYTRAKRNKAQQFHTRGLHQIRGLGAETKKYIAAIQPFSQRNQSPYRELRDLNWISNQDKHRLAHLFGIKAYEGRWENAGDHNGCTLSIISNCHLYNGSVIGKIVCTPAKEILQVPFQIRNAISVHLPPQWQRGEEVSLWRMYAECANIILILLSSMGQQDTPIDLRLRHRSIDISSIPGLTEIPMR